MEKISALFNKSWKINLALFLCSFGIYFFYFYPIFLNINSILSSITLDSLKNYYTYAYHVKNDSALLHFSGMNYPFGEHIIYTDCQPILTFILRLFPFSHNYLIGILHSLMFLSFIITPLILNRILVLFHVDKFFSFFASLAIALLSPQFTKINGGHFALAYGCLVPVSILLISLCLRENKRSHLIKLFAFNTFLFLLHPYMGFCLSVFSFLSLLFFELLSFNRKAFVGKIFTAGLVGLIPLLLFKLFMLITDSHANRTIEPFGAEMMVENTDSILSPIFGPFKNFMEYFFPNRAFHFEGHSYLGFFTILLLFLLLLSIPFTFKKIRFRREMLVLFFASFVFLLISFGVHLKIFNLFGIQSATVNQFRAVCRFAWIFYFTLPLFITIIVHDLFKDYLKPTRSKTALIILSLLFFSFNLLEANYFFTFNTGDSWKYSNFFREELLNAEEKKNLQEIAKSDIQAIIPLPLFHGGTEMYDRTGSNNSMIPSMIYSYHSGKPIFSALLSRTSISETEEMLQLMNSYKKEKPVRALLNSKDFFVLTTKDALLPDEARLLKKVKQFGENDTLKFGYLSVEDLFKTKLQDKAVLINHTTSTMPDTASVVFIPFENRKPFAKANMMDFETLFVLDSNKIKSGAYVVSFHYPYAKKTYKSLAINLIITKSDKAGLEWQYNIPLRYLSGFYNGYGVFEYKIELEKNKKYEFILKGYQNLPYTVSNFMLRPEDLDVFMIEKNKDSIINNFPFH